MENEIIEKLSKKAFLKIEIAAGTGKSTTVQKLTQLLPQIDKIKNDWLFLFQRIQQINNEIDTIHESEDEYINLTFVTQNKPHTEKKVTARAKAKTKRLQFINDLKTKGIQLIPYQGVVLKNSENEGLVGVAYSSEYFQSWFLGLPDWGYSTVVLLCDSLGGIMNPIILGSDFYREYSKYFSRSHGQVKFNVRKQGEDFVLYSKKGNMVVNDLIGNLAPFGRNDRLG